MFQKINAPNYFKMTLIFGAFLLFKVSLSAQPFKISNGNNELTIGTILSSYMNLREYSSGTVPKLLDNTFKLKDARLDINGKMGTDYEFNFQIDMGGWGAVYDPAAPLIDDAHFTYKGWKKLFNIRFGYGKVPYSVNSLVEHEWSPFWERPLITKGDFFSRRDLGIRLDRAFWNKRIHAYAGAYTGTGEVVLGGSNDPSGSFEYIGRLEFSYPENHMKEIVDINKLSKLNIGLGINARYSKRNLPAGTSFLAGEEGALVDSGYNFKVVNGEKYILGLDLSLMYKGFSAQFEAHQLKGMPYDPNSPLLMGFPKSITGGYFKAGGWFGQLNYFSKPIKSIFSIRYDELDVNDLLPGNSKHLSGSYSYQLKGFNSMIRVEFYRNLDQNESINLHKWENEYRIGWQFMLD